MKYLKKYENINFDDIFENDWDDEEEENHIDIKSGDILYAKKDIYIETSGFGKNKILTKDNGYKVIDVFKKTFSLNSEYRENQILNISYIDILFYKKT